MKKRILFIVPSMRGGGSERVISIILNNLDRNKFDIILVLLKKEGQYLDDLPSDIQIINLNVKQARYALLKIIKAIKQKKPNIVFSTLGYLNILISIIRPFFSKKIKFIARESSIVSIQNKQERYPKLFDFLYKNFYKNFDFIVAQSSYMKDDLIDKYKIEENKIKVIHNPVDIEKIEKKLKNDLYFFSKEQYNLLAVGRLSHEKGYDLFLQAMAKLDEKYNLVIIGDGLEKENLIKLSKELNIQNRVRFLGFQDNPYKYMAQADLMVLSSRYEGLPNVVLEANACGLPVVAFDCPGGTSEIIEDGVNGFLVECGNVEELAKKIKQTINYNWEKNKIKFQIMDNFNLNVIIQKYESLLMELV